MAKKILIVGGGGIGSWLAPILYELERHEQLNKAEITIADNDTIEEKTLTYQNFGLEDLTDDKAESLSARYGFGARVERIEDPKAFKHFDCVISAVDNAKFRRMLFKAADKNEALYWIDLRSEGRTVAAFTKHKVNTLEKMLATVPDEDTEEGGSCQLEYELSAGIIQNGNKIIAAVGSQYILNWLRSEDSPPEFSALF